MLYLACSRLGAVLNPLMPIFREHELSFMLAHGEAKVFVVPKSFRGFDHEAMARGHEAATCRISTTSSLSMAAAPTISTRC